jgi:hypothetical protein
MTEQEQKKAPAGRPGANGAGFDDPSNVANPAENASENLDKLPFNLDDELHLQTASLFNAGTYLGAIKNFKREWFSTNPTTATVYDSFLEWETREGTVAMNYEIVRPEVFSNPHDLIQAVRLFTKARGSDRWKAESPESEDSTLLLRNRLETLFKARKQWEKSVGDPAEVYRLENESVVASMKLSIGSIFYESEKGKYLMRNTRSGYMSMNEGRLRRHLKTYGFTSVMPEGSTGASSIDHALNYIELNNNVDFAGPLAGHKPGPQEVDGGMKILVTTKARLIEPDPDPRGSFKLLDSFFKGILGSDSEPDQIDFFYSWLGICLKELRTGVIRSGPAIALVGPPDVGKTLFKKILTFLLGGRQSQAGRYLKGATEFNAELFKSELWALDDEICPQRFSDRQGLGQFIKKIVADCFDSLHPKGQNAIPVSLWRRLIVCCNDSPEAMAVLPPIDGSEGLDDKLAILKAYKFEDFPKTSTAEEQAKFWERVAFEAPYFVNHLIHRQIPEKMRSRRWGVKVYQNQEVFRALTEDQPDQVLKRLIRNHITHSASWAGTSEDLLYDLKKIEGPNASSFEDLRLSSRGLGRLLKTLCTQDPENFQFKREASGRLYHIKQYRNDDK